jgi:transketolase
MIKEIIFSPIKYQNIGNSESDLARIANMLRQDVIKSLFLAKSGHTGGSLGMADIFAVLFFGGIIRYDSRNWKENLRDRFVLSAGHIAPILYASLARAGFFEPEELATLRKLESRLQGHPGLDTELPGIETSAGSLGQGISIAVGMAISHKLIDKTDQLVISVTGDGELQEGTVWEAAMSASNFKLSNLCWIVDNNDCQIDGRVSDVMNIYPLDKKFESFGFNVIKIDGNDISQIINAFKQFKENSVSTEKPTCILAKTIMGKGVSFIEDKYQWHGIPPNEDEMMNALTELENNILN